MRFTISMKMSSVSKDTFSNNSNSNSILIAEIPAAILQPPFFDHELPFSMNFGGIGAIIGHEFTHAFDNDGAKRDGHGHRANWWTNETLAKFNEKGQCFEKQYEAFLDPLSGMRVSLSFESMAFMNCP